MTEDIFASCYVDECIGDAFVKALRSCGIKVKSAQESGATGFDDKAQLQIATVLQSVLITIDKRTFLQDSDALRKEHYGIIIILRQVGTINATAVAEEVFEKFLNIYPKDEWKNFVVQL